MLYVLQQVVRLLIMGMEMAMFGRAICSWIPFEEDNPIENFFIGVTEPIIYPFRVLFHKMNWFAGFPLDMSFMAAVLALGLLGIYFT